jgi:D-arabinose 1-dehydrogenase-like Zn-dependent alcohol dehydrogenase
MTAWQLVAGEPRAVTGGDAEPPAPGVDEVVVAVEAAWLPRDVRATAGVAGGAAVGAVAGAGDQARALIGRRVVVAAHVACGECEVCRRGGAAVCPRGGVHGATRRGTLAARITVPVRAVTVLDDGLAVPGPEAAAVPGDVALAYALYVRAGIGPGEPAVVCGDDACARFLVQVLAAKGVAIVDAAAAATRGDAERPLKLFATTATARPAALALAGPRATVIARVTADGGAVALAPELLAREVAFHAVAGAHPDLMTEILALVVRGDVTLAGAVDVVAIDAVATALATPSDRAVVVTL